MVWHFSKIFEGYMTMLVAPLPRHYLSKIPDQGPGQRRGLPRRRDRRRCRSRGPFKYESVTPAAELRLAQATTNYTSPKTASRPHLDSLVFKWYGDAGRDDRGLPRR